MEQLICLDELFDIWAPHMARTLGESMLPINAVPHTKINFRVAIEEKDGSLAFHDSIMFVALKLAGAGRP
jgi:hypothetical protein